MKEFQADIEAGNQVAVAEKLDKTIDAIIDVASEQLTENGYGSDAYTIQGTWRAAYKGKLPTYIAKGHAFKANEHDIGDHPAEEILHFLAVAYKQIEKDLCGEGVENCMIVQLFHISDLYTICETTKIAFMPCDFSMDGIKIPRRDEFRANMVKGLVYTGLYPVVVYWGVLIGSSAAGAGMGSGLIASAAEWICEDVVCQYVSNFIFDQACGN